MTKTKQQVIDDGAAAKRLLNDTDLVRFLDEIEQDCWSEFKATGVSDAPAREAIFVKLRGVQMVSQTLRAMSDNADIELKRK